MPNPVVGQAVVYVPDAAYWLDKDKNSEPCFTLLHRKTRKPYLPSVRGRKRPTPAAQLQPGAPTFCWKAVVTAVHSDGTADLEIYHPFGTHRLFHSRVRCDAEKAWNTWHFREN